LLRSLVLTRAFQLSSRPSTASREVDPLNRLLQHYPARRMEAEAVRDSILAVSGRLDRTLYGMSIPSFRETPNADRRLFADRLDHMFQVALGRKAEGEELRRAEQTVARLAELHEIDPTDILRSHTVWKDVAHALFNLKEFIYIR